MIGETHRKLDLPPPETPVSLPWLSDGDVKPAEPRREIDVDGMADRNHPEISFIGKATLMTNGKWRCLANVSGMMCLVECNTRRPA